LDTLIDEILLASRLDMLPALDVEEPVELLALCAEEGARFAAQVDGEEAVVQGSPRLLRRMVRNLLDNARRHGGDEHIEVMVRRNAVDQALLTVCDCGPGVPEAERERIFEPFYRPAGTREADGGVGLGLALVRQIARKHRGEVVCRSRAGGGSCFEVELPAATASRT
jgi:signal transduction histidine kinase